MQPDYEEAHLAFVDDLPEVGDSAPDFLLVDTELGERGLIEWRGERKLIVSVPAMDLPATRELLGLLRDHQATAAELKTLLVSLDTPFAIRRALDGSGLEEIIGLSAFRAPKFGEHYGIRIKAGVFMDMLALAAFVLDENNTVTWAGRASSLEEGLALEPLQRALGLDPVAEKDAT